MNYFVMMSLKSFFFIDFLCIPLSACVCVCFRNILCTDLVVVIFYDHWHLCGSIFVVNDSQV